MSKVRPECGDNKSKYPVIEDWDALYRVREAVKEAKGLGFGALYDKESGENCAIGAFWERNPKTALHSKFIDEIATYNDSIPKHLSPRTRKNRVLAWLNYRIDVLRGKGESKS